MFMSLGEKFIELFEVVPSNIFLIKPSSNVHFTSNFRGIRWNPLLYSIPL